VFRKKLNTLYHIYQFVWLADKATGDDNLERSGREGHSTTWTIFPDAMRKKPREPIPWYLWTPRTDVSYLTAQEPTKWRGSRADEVHLSQEQLKTLVDLASAALHGQIGINSGYTVPHEWRRVRVTDKSPGILDLASVFSTHR